MIERLQDILWLPATVLFSLGLIDIIRGLMHTFVLTWSARNIARLDLTKAPKDQLFLLGVFGISNFLTGFLYLLISVKARELSPAVLLLIPLAYLIGLIGIRSGGGVRGQAAFNGKYFMFVYFGTCLMTFLIFLIQSSG